jgi:hypothetical protein
MIDSQRQAFRFNGVYKHLKVSLELTVEPQALFIEVENLNTLESYS